MSAGARGFLGGLAVTLVLAALTAPGTRFDAYVRVADGDRLLLDARLDEPIVSRLINIPAGALGEASFVKRWWGVVTTYAFVLHIRPEVAPGPGRTVRDLQVSVRLPGAVSSTNATRVAGSAAVWETLPDELRVDTRAVHWIPAIVLALAVLGALTVGRRS